MTDHGQLPALVQRAQELAVAEGFPLTRAQAAAGQASASLPGTGRFLAVLAARCADQTIAELGTGVGIGTAWLASSMPASCRLVTVEVDERLAAAARQLFAADDRVEVITGDASELAARGPFALLFADCGVRDQAAFDGWVSLLAPGGTIVMDDVTPLAQAPLAPDSDDLKRTFFTSPRLVSTEVVLPDLRNSLLVGTARA